MAKARSRYFEISPSWAGGTAIGLGFDSHNFVPLTQAVPFAEIERRLGRSVPSSGQFKYSKWPKAIPDFVHATGDVAIVTLAFKSIIEALAPGEAEFRPFALRWPDDEPVAGDWYVMNVLNLIDCFDYERMGHPRPATITLPPYGELWPIEREGWQYWIGQHYSFSLIYIQPAAVGSLHIWRPFFQSQRLFCTGETLKALKAAGVKRLHADRLGTRDDPVPVFNRVTGLFEMPEFPET